MISGERQIRRISLLDGLLIGLAHAFHAARPASRAVILVIKLDAETARVIAFRDVHEGRDVSVIEKAFVVDGWLADQFLKKRFEPSGDMRDEVLAQFSARVSKAGGKTAGF